MTGCLMCLKAMICCLYSERQWRPDLRISEYIIPWIYVWLRFYEVWLATGYWEGGGTGPKRCRKHESCE